MNAFNPSAMIRVAADNVKVLRKCDVFRLLNSMAPGVRQAMADYVVRERPELADEVKSCLKDIAMEEAADTNNTDMR